MVILARFFLKIKKKYLTRTIKVILALLIILIMTELSLRIAGAGYLYLLNHRNHSLLKNNSVCRILCLGESTTACGGDYAYPFQLERILNKQRPDKRFCVINGGIPGCDTDDISANLNSDLIKYDPDIVVVMMGVNDSGMSRSFMGKHLRIIKLLKFLRQSAENLADQEYAWGNIYYQAANLELWLKRPQKAKVMFIKSIQRDYQYREAYLGLSRCYEAGHALADKADTAKSLISLNLDNYYAYILLSLAQKENNQSAEAEKSFQKAILAFKENCRLRKVNAEQSRQFLETVIADPINNRNKPLIHELLHACIKADPEYYAFLEIVFDLGEDCPECRAFIDRYAQANPKKFLRYDIGEYFIEVKDYKAAREYYERIIVDSRDNSTKLNAYRGMALCYQGENEDYSAVRINDYADDLELSVCKKQTALNYQKIKKILSAKKIKFICVQYPCRRIAVLRKILGQEDVVYVDNELLFKQAINAGTRKEYFQDNFAGDFGHCTEKGNKLLAENIAGVIIENWFNLGDQSKTRDSVRK